MSMRSRLCIVQIRVTVIPYFPNFQKVAADCRFGRSAVVDSGETAIDVDSLNGSLSRLRAVAYNSCLQKTF